MLNGFLSSGTDIDISDNQEVEKLSKTKQLKRRVKMKKLFKKLEDVYAAAAYAEAGEHETAREIMREEKRTQKREQITKRPRTQLRAPGINR